MKIPALVIIILTIIAAGYFYIKNAPMEKLIPEQATQQVATTGMTKDQAIENVKKLPEVQDYLKRVPNGRVEVDNEAEGEYNVHVYEVKNGHTATFNWYRVSIKSAEVGSEFSIEQQQQSPK